MAKTIYGSELKINLHYRGRAIQCITVNFCSLSCHCVQATCGGQGFVADTVDFGKVACVRLVTGPVRGGVPVLTVLGKSFMPPRMPLKGQGRYWVSESGSIKQMAANGLFPLLRGGNS